jgi:hypothetical protein
MLKSLVIRFGPVVPGQLGGAVAADVSRRILQAAIMAPTDVGGYAGKCPGLQRHAKVSPL